MNMDYNMRKYRVTGKRKDKNVKFTITLNIYNYRKLMNYLYNDMYMDLVTSVYWYSPCRNEWLELKSKY